VHDDHATTTVDAPQEPLARRPLAVVAALTAGLLIALSGRYGYHRDELYFLECGRHLAWGYPDQPPFVPVVARLMSGIAPTSLVVLRLPSAIAIAIAVYLTGVIAREFGADRKTQTLAAGGLALGNFVLGTGHLLSTTTFDLPIWAGIVAISLRAVRSGRNQLWLGVGALAGVGLLDSDLVAFLMVGLVVGVAACGPRQVLRSPWLYAGALIAVAIWSPYLVWQAQHGWPELTIAHNIANGGSGTSAPRWQIVPFQVLLAGIWLTPLWVAGLVRLIRDPGLRWCRALPVCYGVLVVLFLVTGGKPYYLAGFFPVLLAAGAAPVLAWCRRVKTRRWLIPVGGVLTLVGLPIVLPILPLSALSGSPVVALNYDAGETVAWPTYVAQIASVYSAMPPTARANAIVLGSNYGEGGAVDRYGAQDGLPAAYAVQNAFWLWGPPPAATNRVVAVGFDRTQLLPLFGSVRLARRLDNHLGVDDDEQGAPVWVCSTPREPWLQTWHTLRDYG
jgi:4-amino-4-deoxy-L-arabinose transferase-like glycosyltransferase